MEIQSNPTNLITIEEFISYVAKEEGLDPDKLPGLLIAITEATTNAIIHANKKDESKKVFISVDREENKLIFVIKDEGLGFDPENIPDPTAPENLMKDSGRGLYLMRIFCDELKYNITPTGTETILIVSV
ncbi:MAG: ATP-binding protein [Chlorobiaceae bacterium]|nr:ATP-binding protein [Chlorobiaceae bacterium]MBA4310249.1 ATP-binding protein [Chlorobiaceae bacterium]